MSTDRNKENTTDTIPETIQRLIQKMADTFDNGPFHKVRSSDSYSVFSNPSSIYGQMPHITAEDDHQRFYIMELIDVPNMDPDFTKERLSALTKNIETKKSTLWIFIPMGHEVPFKELLTDWGMIDAVKRIKGISFNI